MTDITHNVSVRNTYADTASAQERKFFLDTVKKLARKLRWNQLRESALRALCLLWFHHDRRQSISPGYENLANKLRCSIRTIKRIIAEFVEWGFIQRIGGANGYGVKMILVVDLDQMRETVSPSPVETPGSLVELGGQNDTPSIKNSMTVRVIPKPIQRILQSLRWVSDRKGEDFALAVARKVFGRGSAWFKTGGRMPSRWEYCA